MHDGEVFYTEAQHEKEMTRVETQCHRWFLAFLAVLCALVLTNAGWVVYEKLTDHPAEIVQEIPDGEETAGN